MQRSFSYRPGRFAVAVLATIALASPLSAEEQESRSYLLGDWGGERTALADKGVAFEAIITTDLIANVSGGLERTSRVLSNFDLTAALDTEKLGWWSGGTFFAYVLGNVGGDPTSFVGDTQASDNIETYDTAKLYEAWYEHLFMDGAVSIKAGLHDYNSEFNALEYAGTLINSSFGIEPDISQVGPSIFATTALGVRLMFQPTDHFYLMTVVYDGIPGDPENPRGTRVRFDDGDGVFWGTELGATSSEEDPYYKVAVGGWYHTAEFEDYSGNLRDSNGGLYGIAEYTLFTEDDDAQGLGVFFQSGFARADRNQVAHYYGAGLTYTGLIPSRDADTVSIGMALARNASGFRSLGEGVSAAEVAFEFTYRLPVTEYFSIQPDVQYIRNPGTDPEVDDAVVLGVRTELAL